MNTMNTVDPRLSVQSLRMGGGTVAADKSYTGAVSVANAVTRSANGARMDADGALSAVSMRALIGQMLQQASERGMCRFDGDAQLDDHVRRLAKARIETPEGRLDDRSIGLVGSDRADSASASAALSFARDLEYMTNEVYREEGPVLSAKRLFGIDSSMPAGARTYSVQKISHTGAMKFWKGDGSVPLVNVGRDKRSFTVAYSVIGMQADFFEDQRDAYAGFNQWAEKVRAMRQATAEFENIVFWDGAEEQKLYGLRNFPWLQRVRLASALVAPTTDAQFEDRAALLSGFLNDIADRNPGMDQRLRLVWSGRITRRLSQSRHPTTQKTLLQRFREDNPQVVEIAEAPELQGRVASTRDEIIVHPVDSAKAPVLVQPEGFRMLPVQMSNFGLTRTQAGYMSIGGARYKEALRSTLVEIDME